MFPVRPCSNVTVQDNVALIVDSKTVNVFKTIYLHRQRCSKARKDCKDSLRQKCQSRSHVTDSHIYFLHLILAKLPSDTSARIYKQNLNTKINRESSNKKE